MINRLIIEKDELAKTLNFLVEDKSISPQSLQIAIGDARSRIMKAELEKDKIDRELNDIKAQIRAINDKGVGETELFEQELPAYEPAKPI